MTNIDRAVLTIVKQYNGAWFPPEGSPVLVAQALADAGLLAPELPEPSNPGIFVPNGAGWLPGGPDGPSVWTAPHGRIMVQRIEPGELTPDEARELALALLAAANHARVHDAN